MQQLLKSKRFKAFLCIVAALLIGVLLAVVTDSNSSPASSAFGILMQPVQKLSAIVSEKMSEFDLKFQSSSKYLEEIENLKKQIAEYEDELVDYEETKKKLNSYSEMLDIKEDNPDYKLCPADIIGRDSLDAFYSFIIDKGASDGISANDPVVYGNYVVGVVHSVKETYSVVWTVLNPKVNISAIESRTRESGYTTTTAELSLDGKCMLSGLDKSTKVSVGGIVCTSGIGGIYPKGLIIGKISDVQDNDYDISLNAVIDPGVNITELEDIFIITDFKEQGVSDIDSNEE